MGAKGRETRIMREFREWAGPRTTDDFWVGQLVQLTDKACESGMQGRARSRYGVVRRLRSRYWIGVQRDGLKSVERYHCRFWAPARPAKEVER